MSKQTRNRIASRLLARTESNRRKQAAKQPEQAESPKRDTGPCVVGYRPDEPAWADPNWRPATSANTSELLARHERMQVWAQLKARYAPDDGDPYGRRIPAGFDWLTGHKL